MNLLKNCMISSGKMNKIERAKEKKIQVINFLINNIKLKGK